jgi:hypothetical protein
VNAITMHHEPSWVTAAPLWQDAVSERERMRRPAILRFATDSFMEELYRQLESEPAALVQRDARGGSRTLKLFQPVHGHFHLVAASLVCGLPGLPDHGVERAREKVSFVLRRREGERELAWIPGPDAQSPGSWQLLADEESVASGEEQLPLFAAGFVQDGTPRKLWLGLVPTTSRDTARPRLVQTPSEEGDDGETVLSSRANAADAIIPKLGARAGTRFVLRCVYQRSGCMPPHPPRVSEPSEPFTLATYFDADAPARNIRIAMPNVADLANLKRGLGFALPAELNRKLHKITPKVFKDPQELDPDGPDMGEICSFSIPILTLVAMILLMLIVMLLQIVFGWMAWVKVCLPFPLRARTP